MDTKSIDLEGIGFIPRRVHEAVEDTPASKTVEELAYDNVALIARIRELEAALTVAESELASTDWVRRKDYDAAINRAVMEERQRCLELVARRSGMTEFVSGVVCEAIRHDIEAGT